jgi:hypothetical protein
MGVSDWATTSGKFSNTSGPATQISQAMACTGFRAVSLRASPPHRSGRGIPYGHPVWSHSRSRQRPSPEKERAFELRKLVAGVGFEPTTSGL